MPRAGRRDGLGEQYVREKRRAGNFGFAICYAIQVSLKSLGVVLEEVLAVDVHASGLNIPGMKIPLRSQT